MPEITEEEETLLLDIRTYSPYYIEHTDTENIGLADSLKTKGLVSVAYVNHLTVKAVPIPAWSEYTVEE